MAWMPEPIYRKLPTLYVLAGGALIAFFGVDNPGALSGLIFFAAAALTGYWRHSHRASDTGAAQGAAQTSAKAPSRHRIEWEQRRARASEPLRYK